MTQTSRNVILKSRALGLPAESDFELTSQELREPSDGEVLVENLYMSVDPYMRGRMRDDWQLNEVMDGAAVGRVVHSRSDVLAQGDVVVSSYGWRERFVAKATALRRVDTDLAPVSSYLGVMGMPGLTAWGGLLTTGQLRDGETVFVSAASGAVGNLVGQIARLKGCRVIGSAGTDAKVRRLLEIDHFDHAFNYRTANPLDELKKGAPQGIDVYFENVGGAQLEAALEQMNEYGRIPVCGMIAHYNDSETPTPGPTNLRVIIYKKITIKGFVSSEFVPLMNDFQAEMGAWLADERIHYQETIVDGIEQAASAFIGLFSGKNEGKMLVKLA